MSSRGKNVSKVTEILSYSISNDKRVAFIVEQHAFFASDASRIFYTEISKFCPAHGIIFFSRIF